MTTFTCSSLTNESPLVVVVAPPPPPPKPQPPIIETANTNVNRKNEGSENEQEGNTKSKSSDGFDQILLSMFPNCPLEVINGMLGDNPTKEKAREVANELSSMNFSEKQDTSGMTEGTNSRSSEEQPEMAQQQHNAKEIKKRSGGIMGRMMGGLRPSSVGGSKASSLGRRVIQQQTSERPSQNGAQSLPQNDAESQQSLEAMLQDSVQSTSSVNNSGVSAPETLLKSLPQGLESASEGEHYLSRATYYVLRWRL